MSFFVHIDTSMIDYENALSEILDLSRHANLNPIYTMALSSWDRRRLFQMLKERIKPKNQFI